VLAAAGGGFFGWQQHQELGRTKSELTNTRGALDKAAAEARTAKADAASARKELDDQKASFEQMRVERDAAKAFLDTERAHSARLQQDLTLAREQMAYMRSRSSSPARVAEPMLVQPRPARIEAIRTAPRAVAAPAPATPAAR
jgi:chromosome segregation ATPase